MRGIKWGRADSDGLQRRDPSLITAYDWSVSCSSNWNPGEPNNAGQGEDCVMMRGSGQWNDAYCRSYLDAWVCEQLATCEEASAPVASVSPTGPTPKNGS